MLLLPTFMLSLPPTSLLLKAAPAWQLLPQLPHPSCGLGLGSPIAVLGS